MKPFVFLIIFFILIVSLGTVNAQLPLSFQDEYIDFSLDNHYFTINGIYYFINKTGNTVEQRITFPFAVSSRMADTIRVFDLKRMVPLVFEKYPSGITFVLMLQPNDSIPINIYYRQPAAKKNVYILRSALAWGEPLQTANYTLTVSPDIVMQSFSYKPDTSIKLKDKTVYYWKKKIFLPDKEFEVDVK